MLRKENEGWWNLHAAATGEREGRVIGLPIIRLSGAESV